MRSTVDTAIKSVVQISSAISLKVHKCNSGFERERPCALLDKKTKSLSCRKVLGKDGATGDYEGNPESFGIYCSLLEPANVWATTLPISI